jgi:hypothetical protein
MSDIDRRTFFMDLGCRAVGGAAGWRALQAVVPALAEDAKVTPEIVKFRPEMEEVIRWIEETPRERILDEAVDRLKKGLPYRQLVAGVFLAGIRNIKPRPVGFKFHAVMAISAAHQLSLDAPQSDRLLPFFWALDTFKNSQAQDVREGDWTLAPVKESAVPSPSQSRQRFVEAMERWDDEAADVAITGLFRSAGAGEVMELLWNYGIRDQQNIGHKAIFTAHAFRTLEVIGWEHAEPVLRSLVFGLLNGGKTDTVLPMEHNKTYVSQIRPDWAAGKQDFEGTRSMLQTLRQANTREAAAAVVEQMNKGVSANSLWDAILLAGSELLMRKAAIVTLHATTSCNSLFYAFRQSGNDTTRLLTLLQAASWITMFRDGALSRNDLPDKPHIDEFEPANVAPTDVATIFDGLDQNRVTAAAQALAYARGGGNAATFFDAARRLILAKGTDAHDYKFAVSAMEDFMHASSGIRPQLLAASVFYLKGTGDADSPLIQRARAALSTF